MQLRDVTPADVAAFPAWRVTLGRGKDRVSGATVNRAVAHFKALFSWLVSMKHVPENPVSKLKMLAEYRGEEPIRIIEPQRFEAIVAELEREGFTHWANACIALLGTGMRWGSLVKLRPEHLNESRRLVRLSKPKGKNAIDLQITSERVWAALRWCAADAGYNPDVGSFNKALARACKAANVEHVTAHMFRHTFAVRALDAGANVRDVQRWLGHSQLAMTERYLRHAKPKPPPEML